MASLSDIVKEKIKLFDSTPDKMGTATEKVQLKIWKDLLPIVNDLEVDSTGNIIQSDNNVARIGIIADKLNEVLAGKEYQAVIKTFLNSIDEGVVLTNDVAQKFDPAFEPNAAQTKLLQISKTNAIDTFIGSGLKNNVTQPFVEQLVTNVSARAPLRETINALQGVILGTDANEGLLLRHIKTTALTAQAVADRSYSSAVNETIGAVYFEYLGGEIPTTRPFCQHREGEVFHKGEIEQWGRGINSGGIDDIEDGTWAGRIDGTDAKTIFTFVGGWNCRHYLVPIESDLVDPSVKARAKAEGFIGDFLLKNKKEIDEFIKDSELKETFYHSTPSNNVESIKNEGFKSGKMTIGKFMGEGTYLTDNKKVSNFYNDLLKGKNPKVLQTKVDIKKPFVYDDDAVVKISNSKGVSIEDAQSQYLNRLFKENPKFESRFKKIFDSQEKELKEKYKIYYDLDADIRKYAAFTPERIAAVRKADEYFNENLRYMPDTYYSSIRKAAQELGYDAFYFKTSKIDSKGGQQIVIFDNNNIKIID